MWSVEKHEAVAQWTGVKALNSALKWSPRRMLVASADSVLALWVPNKKLLQSTGRWPVIDAYGWGQVIMMSKISTMILGGSIDSGDSS